MDAQKTALWTTALLLFAGAVHAQDVTAVPPGPDTIIPVKKGEPSPIDGQLFDNPTSLRWANWLVSYKNLVKNNKELDQTICTANVNLEEAKLKYLQQQYDTVTADLQKKLSAAQEAAANPPWYDGRTFGVVLGVAGTLAVVVVTAYAVHK